MAFIRLTMVRPRPGSEQEVRRLMEELDSDLAESPGFIFSFVMTRESQRIGRVSLWRSKEDANREAMSQRTISLRSQLHHLSTETEESVMEVESGHLPEGFSRLFTSAKQAVRFPPSFSQPALPV